MPVVILVAKHEARTLWAGKEPTKTSRALLNNVAPKLKEEIGDIIQASSSLSDFRLSETHILACDNGLVQTAFLAYTAHHHLVLRPEDIWFAILSQFSFYVNANAEELRSSFVSHEGKKGLILEQEFLDGVPDYGSMCSNMTRLIEKNIVDPALRTWVLPSFTTTTVEDEIVAGILMMGMLKRYFDYVFDPTDCGIPTVTLLGEQRDWEDIQQRIEKLAEYGDQPTQFLKLLRPICALFVTSFSRPAGDPEVIDFWSRIVHYSGGSGTDTLSGWLAAFCFWDEDGKRLAKENNFLRMTNKMPPSNYDLGDSLYHEVELPSVPAGYVTVPVFLILPGEVVQEAKLLAGSVGRQAMTAIDMESEGKLISGSRVARWLSTKSRSSGFWPLRSKIEKPSKKEKPPENTLNTVRPVTGWWLYELLGGKFNGTSKTDFLNIKRTEEWSGSSTGRVIGEHLEVRQD